MNSLKKNYFELMDDYDITKASRIVQEFAIDELSNWYVRRNRKRFRNPANRKICFMDIKLSMKSYWNC